MSLKRLIIIGAGGLGREVMLWASAITRENRSWELYGYLDDNLNALQGFNIDYKVINTISDYKIQTNDVFICAIGDPTIKLRICLSFINKKAEFINIIHPSNILGESCEIGKGNILCPYSIITSNVTLGNFITINVHSTVGHDAIIEDGCTLSGHCDVTGGAYLEKGVFLGSGARILPKAHVGEFATVGAGTVVLRKVQSNRTVFGVPAKYIN